MRGVRPSPHRIEDVLADLVQRFHHTILQHQFHRIENRIELLIGADPDDRRGDEIMLFRPGGRHRHRMQAGFLGNLEVTLGRGEARSEEHTSELQSLMRTSYAVFCLKKKIILTTYSASKLTNKIP